MTHFSARLHAGILQPQAADAARCVHCSLPVARGCRCAFTFNDRRRNTEPQPIGGAGLLPWLADAPGFGPAHGRA